MAKNGELKTSELVAIKGGKLAPEAAAGWKARGGPEAHGLLPAGPASSYRPKGPASKYGTQEWFWNHQPPLAARPGTSNHGWGLAVDLKEPWMRGWVDDHGRKFGWAKTEAWSEWWHVNFIPGSGPFKPKFRSLQYGKWNNPVRVRFYTRRLAFIRRKHGKPYLKRPAGRPGSRFRPDVKVAVELFQFEHGLKADGIIGEKTAHKIGEVFHRQWVNRKGKRHRSLRVAVREVPAEVAAKLRNKHSNQSHDHK